MPRTLVSKRENTIQLPAHDLLSVEVNIAGELGLLNHGPGNLWVSRTPGVTAAVGSEEAMLLKSGDSYWSVRALGFDPRSTVITMIADSPATVTWTIGV